MADTVVHGWNKLSIGTACGNKDAMNITPNFFDITCEDCQEDWMNWFLEDNGFPLYWHEHEFYAASREAQNALFKLQQRFELVRNEGWRDVYRLRCDAATVERQVQLHLGYKDGHRQGHPAS